jgi:glycosyltransferase involved in cell wall biosynthesis
MAKRTILLAVPYFYPQTGGMEHYAHNIAKGLRSNGWRVVIATSGPVETMQKTTIDDFTVYQLPIWKVISNTPVNPKWFSMLRQVIRAEQPDVINTHTPVPFMADMAGLAAGRRPYVVTYHAATLFKPGSSLMTVLTWFYLPMQAITLFRAKAIVAVSPYVKASLSKRNSRKTHVIHNAVNLPKTFGQNPGNGLVFIANLEATHSWKGLSLILTSIGRIRDLTGTAPHLTIIGDGSARAEYERQVADLYIEEFVTFAGRRVGADRDRWLRRGVALIAYPTTANDAFPTVFVEAWSEGLPIIAAAIGPIPSLISNKKTGILVKPNDPAALATAIIKLFEDPTRITEMGAEGRALVENQYTWPRQVDRTAKLLEKLI